MPERDTLPASGFSDLIGRAVAGDRDALGELLRASHDELHRYIAARLPAKIRSAVDVDDVVQETYGVVIQRIGHYRPSGRGAFLAWLRAIASSRVVDVTRAQSRKKRGGDLRRVNFTPGASRSMVHLVSLFTTDGDTPFHDACRAEAAKRTNDALAELPADYRTVVRLRFFEDRGTREIADALDRTYAAAAGLLKRSKQKLRQALGPT